MNDYLPDKYLYHYTKTDTLLNYIFPDKRLLINSISKSNDPREYKYRLFNIRSNVWFGKDGFVNINDKANNILNNNCKALAFSCDSNWNSQSLNFRGYMHPRMWAQYGDKHTGVCLIVSRNKAVNLFLKLNSYGHLFYGEVKYNPRPESRKEKANFETMTLNDTTKESIIEHFLKHNQELFFQKNIDWEDEAEFRFLIIQNIKSADKIYLNLTDIICGVVMGSEYPESLLEPLIEYSKEMNLSIGQMEWQDGNGYIGTTLHTPRDKRGYLLKSAYSFNNIDFFS